MLFFDIETAPNLSNVWGHYEQNVLRHVREWHLLCFSYRWAHEKTTKVIALPDYPDLYTKDPESDYGVATALHELLDEADIVIGHNVDKFDVRKSNARFVYWGFGPNSPYRTVDTLKVARKCFMFNSNKLGDLGEFLDLGTKEQTGGFKLWVGCMEGDEKSWRKMKKYAKRDVDLLVKVYEELLPWMKTHPNLNVYSGGDSCTNCASSSLTKRGFCYTNTMTYQRYQCKDCGKYSRSRESVKVIRPGLV